MPKTGEGFIDFIGQVHKTKEQFGQDGPITVHCRWGWPLEGSEGQGGRPADLVDCTPNPVLSLSSAGVGRTGVFITLSIVLERMRYEGVVDMFQTVKTLRTQRPAMVQTEVCEWAHEHTSPTLTMTSSAWGSRAGWVGHAPHSAALHWAPVVCLALAGVGHSNPYGAYRGTGGGCGQWERERDEPSEVLSGPLVAAWGRCLGPTPAAGQQCECPWQCVEVPAGTAHADHPLSQQDQYQLCYRAALEYLGSFDHYAT